MYGETVGTILVSGSNSNGWLASSQNTTTGRTEYHKMRVFHVTLLSWGTASSVLQLFNGSSATYPMLVVGGSTLTYQNPNLGRIEVDADYGTWGHTFPGGCYYTTDGNILQAAVICKADHTA